MRRFWDERAVENALWYIDTSLDADQPDLERFLATGREVVRIAVLDAPVRPATMGHALEIGPGVGRICLALAEHFDRVTGIDVSAEMVERASAFVDSDRIDLLVGDGVSLRPVADATVDLVTSFTVLQHLPGQDLVVGYLREAARVLRPGGVLAVQWNNLPHPRRWAVRARWWRLQTRLGIRGMANEKRSAPEFIGCRVPWPTIAAVLEAEGLDVAGRQGEGTLFAWVWASKPLDR